MSTVDLPAVTGDTAAPTPVPSGAPSAVPSGVPSGPSGVPSGVPSAVPVRWSFARLLGSELGLTFRRPRNLLMLAALAVVPVVLGVALQSFGAGDDAGGAIAAMVGGNGIALTFASMYILVALLMPVTVAVVAGDAVAGEAGLGTLRYLLAAPAGRSRLLAVKYANAVLYGFAAAALVAVAALVTGLLLFPAGPVTLLSGTTVPLWEGLLRVPAVVGYVGLGMAALAAIALAFSTLTDMPIGAIAGVVVLVVVGQVLGEIPQLAAVRPFLLTSWWGGFDALLRDPVPLADLRDGVLAFAGYTAVFGALAWARFTSRDITS